MNRIHPVRLRENEEFSAMDTQSFRMRSGYSMETASTQNTDTDEVFTDSTPVPSIEPGDTNINQLKPGAQLAYIRQQQKMTVNQVAERLCLNPSTIHELENDNYKNLHAPIFIIGYLRNYACLLEKDPEPFLKAFKDSSFPSEQQSLLQPTPTIKKASPEEATDSSDPSFRIITALLVLTMLIFLMLWRMYPTETVNSLPVATGNNPSGAETVPLPLENDNNPPPLSVAADGTVSFPTALPLSESDDEIYTSPIEPDVETKPATETEVESPAAEDPRKLSINFTQDVWLRIVDANGKELFSGTGSSSRPVMVEGEPPLVVRLGRFNGITVDYMGKQFTDMQNYPGRKGREFTFDQPRISAPQTTTP